MNPEKIELEECQYIHITKKNGELIASIPLIDPNGVVIEKNGYVVVFDHNNQPIFEDKDGEIYLVKE